MMGSNEPTTGEVAKARDKRYIPTDGERKNRFQKPANKIKDTLAYREGSKRTKIIQKSIRRQSGAGQGA